MPAQTPDHIRNRLESRWRGYVMKATDDILAELNHPQCAYLAVNDDSKPRWAAAQRLVELGEVELVAPPAKRPTLRPAPGKTERRMRMEMRIRRRAKP